MNKRSSTVILFLFLFSVLLFAGMKGFPSPAAEKGVLKPVSIGKIYDGDTVAAVIEGRREKIRLIGIDAPELEQAPWGLTAKGCIETLMEAQESKVFLEYDIEQRDRHGRILAYIWTGDRRLLNEELLEKGCAVLFTVPPNIKYAERLRTAQKKARRDKVGIWGEKGLQERPYDYRKKHPRR